GCLSKLVYTDNGLFARIDAAYTFRMAGNELFLDIVQRRNNPAEFLHAFDFGPGRTFDLGGLRLDDLAALENIFVFEDVCFVRQNLLDAQTPLLIPGTWEPERLVPRG